MPPPADPVELSALVRDVVESHPRTGGGPVELELPDAEVWVIARRGALHRVLLNLIKNADEACPQGTIRLCLESDAKRARLSVKDEGPGVPLELAQSIFDPFVSAGESGGSGLGLAVSRRIAHEHAGEISLARNGADGATFLLELPTTSKPKERDEVDATASASSLRVLCIDDDESTRETYEMILGLEGHEIVTCADAKSALTLLGEETFDAIISDLRLPDAYGPDLLRRLRELSPELPRRLVFATGDLMNEDSRRFLDGTGNLYLAKPFRVEELRMALEAVTQN